MHQLPQKEMVLLYNVRNKPFTPKLKSILLRLGIKIKVVAPNEFSVPIGTLIGTTAASSSPTAEDCSFSDEMIVMVGFTNARLDLFLKALRKDGILIPLKAILTPQNSTWNALELRNELAKEHKKMVELEQQ